MRPWRKREPEDRTVTSNEFDAFLEGRYIEYLVHQRLAVPAWAWVNQVAHATYDELEAIAAGARPIEHQPSALPWQEAVAAIAQHLMVEANGDDRRLRELQTLVLVPVELALAQEWDRPLHPDKVRDLVLWALATRSGR